MRDDRPSAGQAKLEKEGGLPFGHTEEKPRTGCNVASALHTSEPLACMEARHRPEIFESGESSATWVPSDSCDETSSGGSGSGGSGGLQDAPAADCDLGSLRLRSLLRVANRECSASASGSSYSSSSSDEEVGGSEKEEEREEDGPDFDARAAATTKRASVPEGVSGGSMVAVVGVDDDGKDAEGAAELAAALEAVLLCPPQVLARSDSGRGGGRQQDIPSLSSLMSSSNDSDTPSGRGGPEGGESKEDGDDDDDAAAAAVRAALAWSFPANRLSCVMEECGGASTDEGEAERSTSGGGRDKAARFQPKKKSAWPNKGSAKTAGSRSSGSRRSSTKTTISSQSRRRKIHPDVTSDASVAAAAPPPPPPPPASVAENAVPEGICNSACGSDSEDQHEGFAVVVAGGDTSVSTGAENVGHGGKGTGALPPAAAVVDNGGDKNAPRLGAQPSCVRRTSCDTVESMKSGTTDGGDGGVSGTVASEATDGHGGSENGMDGVQYRSHNNLRGLRLWNSFTSASSSSAPSDPHSCRHRRPWGSLNLGDQSEDDGPFSGTVLAAEREKLIQRVFGRKKAGAVAVAAMASAGSSADDSSRAFFAAAVRIASLPAAELSRLAELDRSSDEEEDGGDDENFFGGGVCGSSGGGSVNGGGDPCEELPGAQVEERAKALTSRSTSSPLSASTTASPRRSSFNENGSARPPLVRVGSARGGGGDDDETAPYRYRRLAGCGRGWPPRVDPARREEWLCPVEFEAVFRVTYAEFKELPPWKQVILKQEVRLF